MKYCATCHATYASHVDSCPADNSVLQTASELVQGMIIRGKYEILEKIATGGMAAVYRARHLAFDEIRAIKVVRGWLVEDEEFVHRLRSEAVIARKLKHPNAVRIDDLDQLEDGRPFIVMEYVEGTNLRKVIHDCGALPLPRALNIARQVASALAAAHNLGIIHRDIKPDNIVLQPQPDGSEHVKVLDFGIAKSLGGAAPNPVTRAAQTRPGLVLCTPEYASPEQARGSNSAQLDGRSDLYSLGVVLYEMITGELPFRSDTPFGIMLAQLNTVPRRASDAKPGLNLPESANSLLMKALEKDPAQRFQSAEQMLEAIASIEGKPAAAPRSTNVLSMPALARPEPDAPNDTPTGDSSYLLDELHGERPRAWLYTSFALLVVLAAIGAWWWMGPHAVAAHVRNLDDRVQQALAGSPAAAQIHAQVSNGVVVLSGEAAADNAVTELATKLASLDGVFRVEKANVHVLHAAATPATSARVAEKNLVQQKAADVPTSSSAEASNGAPVDGAAPVVDRRTQQRIGELFAVAKQQHADGEYLQEIQSLDEITRLDPNNGKARGLKIKAMNAKRIEDRLKGEGGDEQ